MNGNRNHSNEDYSKPDETKPVGLIVPPSAGRVPPDAHQIYPHVPFLSYGLGLDRMDVEGYSTATRRVVEGAKTLAEKGAAGIAIMGTSLTFFRGREANVALERSVEDETGLPCISMSTALAMALRSVGSTTPTLASAYSDEVHGRLSSYLREESFEPVDGANLGLVDLSDLDDVSSTAVVDLGIRAWETAAGRGDALVISCGGLRTRGAMLVLEEAFGVPVVSSPLAGLWAAVGMAGHEARVASLGSLFQQSPAARESRVSEATTLTVP